MSRRGVIALMGGGNKYIVATGGIITRDGDYLVHTFNGTDIFQVLQTGSPGFNTLQYLIVAGGGGGGYSNYSFTLRSGGAGAGGVLIGNFSPAVQSYPGIIGAAGTGAVAGGVPATNGNDSSIFGLTAIGGGRGADGPNVASSGGSSGGETVGRTAPPETPGQGNKGGDSLAYDPLLEVNAGSGGGATGAGIDGTNGTTDVPGGAGIVSSITGSSLTYATGGYGNKITLPIDGGANTGDGGAGYGEVGGTGRAGNGGSGVIVIRYYSPV